jgi:hypothetical protein
MPITYSVDVERARVHAVVEGEFTLENIVAVLQDVVTHGSLRDGFTVLSDPTRVQRPLSSTQLLGLVGLLERYEERFRTVRWAIVSTRPASYGMMRVLAARAELALGMEVRIFFDARSASKWLDFAPGRPPS